LSFSKQGARATGTILTKASLSRHKNKWPNMSELLLHAFGAAELKVFGKKGLSNDLRLDLVVELGKFLSVVDKEDVFEGQVEPDVLDDGHRHAVRPVVGRTVEMLEQVTQAFVPSFFCSVF
jgi:hypothetical protein